MISGYLREKVDLTIVFNHFIAAEARYHQSFAKFVKATENSQSKHVKKHNYWAFYSYCLQKKNLYHLFYLV